MIDTTPQAEILTIGTELLLGEIVDTNTSVIARRLRGIGLNLFRTSTVGDNPERIAQAVREAMARSQAVITTGGLGPTLDDPTRQAIALALDAPLEYHADLWDEITERFKRYGRTPTENNRRQAFLPSGAVALRNPVGTAPAFYVETPSSTLIALPGVPLEMITLLDSDVLPYLRRRLQLSGIIASRVVHTSGAGESWIDERILDLERLANPTVGLSAHPGQVDVRITVRAEDEAAALRELDRIETEVRGRLTEAVFGTGEMTLARAALEALSQRGWRLTTLECGTEGQLLSLLGDGGPGFVSGQLLPSTLDEPAFIDELGRARSALGAEAALGLYLRIAPDSTRALLHLQTPDTDLEHGLSYGGPPANAPFWAAHVALDLLRRSLA
jgi:competence/damage-inducible protein CinA-like protein